MNRPVDYCMTYSLFVDSRAKDPERIRETLTLDKVDLLHAAWGIAGEVMEYYLAKTIQNKIEELHDIGFYVQMIENRFGDTPIVLPVLQPFDIDVSSQQHPQQQYHYLMNKANIFFDLAKKVVIYNNDSKLEEMNTAFVELKEAWGISLLVHGLTIEEANLLNQNKLIKRYAKGYSDKAAAERADKPAGE